MKKLLLKLLVVVSILSAPLASVPGNQVVVEAATAVTSTGNKFTIPKFKQKPYVAINRNKPFFKKKEMKKKAFEKYSPLDKYGRCGVASACLRKKLMPKKDRGNIGMVKPSGWQTVKYDCVPGKYLYNRCHLLGYQLTGENANTKNLITGTRYMNVEGMLPFENMLADYVKETNNPVLYRVTPIFYKKELVARGCLLEAKSVKDHGEDIEFCVFVFNNQPGVKINYKNGKSNGDGKVPSVKPDKVPNKKPDKKPVIADKGKYVLNADSKVFHLPTCPSVKIMSAANKIFSNASRSKLIKEGYKPCGRCHP